MLSSTPTNNGGPAIARNEIHAETASVESCKNLLKLDD